MIYTVTFNPSMDYSLEMASLIPGAVNRAKEAHLTPGGKGINVSVVLSSLGIDNRMLGFIAGFTGTELENCLKKRGYKTDFIRLSRGITRINVKLYGKETTDINAEGPHVSKKDLDALIGKLDSLDKHDMVVLSGSVPPSMPEYSYQLITERMKKKKVDVIVDATGDLLLATLPDKPFLIKPNRHELASLFSEKNLSRSDIEKYARKLREKGARNVLVSMDSEGAMLITEDDRALFEKAPSGTPVNTVGSGDSMIAGFLTAYLKTGSFDESLRLAVSAGSACAFSTGLPSAADIVSLRRLL